MALCEQAQKDIKQFLQDWWSNLSWQVRETLLGTEIPHASAQQLYDSGLGSVLRQIAAAAEGLLTDNEDIRADVHEACQQVAEWMWVRPGMPSTYHIPAEWWTTAIGHLVIRALIWSENDELITLSQAAKITGRTLSGLNHLVVRGKLTGYRDPAEPNPQKATRLRRSEVEKLSIIPIASTAPPG